MAITLAKWQAARADYVEGNGSLRVVAVKHDLRLPTIEKRAAREGWSQLRSQRDDALRLGVAPAPFPPMRLAQDTSTQVGRISKQLEMIEDRMADRKLSEKQLADLTSAHARLFSAWQVLTETPNPGSRRGKQTRPTRPQSYPQPIDDPEPEAAVEASLASG